MKKTYTITTTSAQFVALANKISSELKRERRNVVTIKHPVFVGVYTLDMSWQEIERERAENLANSKGDAQVFICAESEALRDKGITIIVKDWNGETSKLAIEYRDNDDWEFAKDTWQIFEERIKQKGWNLTPTPTAAFAPAIVHDVRHLFEDVRGDSRQEQIEAMKLLHGLGREQYSDMKRQSAANGKGIVVSERNEGEAQMAKQENKATKARDGKPSKSVTVIDILLRSVDATGKRLDWSGTIEHRADSFCRVHVSLRHSILYGTGLDLIFDAKSEKYVVLRCAENHAPYVDRFEQQHAITQECLTFITTLPSEGTRQLNSWKGNTNANESWRFEWFGETLQGAWILAAPKRLEKARQEDKKQDDSTTTDVSAPALTEQRTWRGNGEPPRTRAEQEANLDEIDQKILELVRDNPDLTDAQVGNAQGVNLTRQQVNVRRKRLKAMGYRVR